MHKRHTAFIPPDRTDQPIWRYIDLSKFIHILQTSSLFFPRTDKLGDPFEGSVTLQTLGNRAIFAEYLKTQGVNVQDDFSERLAEHIRTMRQETYISCWHMSLVESAAMWSLYSNGFQSLAIKSTYQRFVNSIAEEPLDVYIGKVNYVDYDTVPIPEDNAFYPLIHKRQSFEHEKELRAIVWLTTDQKNRLNLESDSKPDGVGVCVDISTLFEEVHVSPLAPSWFTDIVNRLLTDQGIKVIVEHSMIGKQPLF
ncbi:MAG: hypothetical protein V1799_06310 [bacterium]